MDELKLIEQVRFLDKKTLKNFKINFKSKESLLFNKICILLEVETRSFKKIYKYYTLRTYYL